MMNGFLYIYKIVNKTNGKIYVGQTNDLNRRWKSHLRTAQGGHAKYPTQHSFIHAAISKYGKTNFSLEIIDIEIDPDVISNLEVYWIGYYQSNNPKFGYNLTIGGECLMGDLNPFYGKRHSEEQKKKWSKDRQGRLAGDSNPKAKLTQIQANIIKISKEKTKVLATRYGVSRTTIQRIRSGKIW